MNSIKEDIIMVFCDIYGSYGTSKGDRKIAIGNFLEMLCKIAELENVKKIKFSFVSSNSIQDVALSFEELFNLYKQWQNNGKFKTDVILEFGQQFGNGKYFLPNTRDNGWLEDIDGSYIKTENILLGIEKQRKIECENIREVMILDDDNLVTTVTGINLRELKIEHTLIDLVCVGNGIENVPDDSLGKSAYITIGIEKKIRQIEEKK